MAQDTALLVIDLQVALTESAYARDEVVAVIQSLVAKAKAAGRLVVYVQHESNGWPPLAHGAATWAIDPALVPAADDPIIFKKASDAFTDTALGAELATRGVQRLVVTGMMTEGCVDSTCRRALSLGYDLTLVADGHTTWDGALPAAQIIAHHNAVIAGLPFPGRQIDVVPAADVRWERP